MFIKFENVSLEFEDKIIFDKINFIFNKGDKIGIIGNNGSGKTSLFNIILNKINYSGGLQLTEKSFGYLPQEILEYKDEQTIIEEKLSLIDVDKSVDEYNELIIKYNDMLMNTNNSLNQELFMKFNINKNIVNRSSNLSGGELTKLRLIQLLKKNHNFYLFDEPSNHLDLKSKNLLIEILNSLDSYMIISHDVEILNKSCNKILEISNGLVKMYYGNYDYYLSKKKEEKEEIIKIQSIHNKKKRKIKNEIEKIENRVKSSQNKAKKIISKSGGILKSSDRVNYQYNKSKMYSFEDSKNKIVKKRVEEINNLNTPTEIRNELIKINSFPIEDSNSQVLKILNLKYQNKNIKLNIDKFNLMKNEKILILGENGIGKTIFLKIIIGEIKKTSGIVQIGERVKIGYINQNNHFNNPQNTISQEIDNLRLNLDESEIRKNLGKFLFKKNDYHKKINNLSGGEKIKLKLLILILMRCNFLILDEPSNHIDINSKLIFSEALKTYNGSILVVSHDLEFSKKFINSSFLLDSGELKPYNL